MPVCPRRLAFVLEYDGAAFAGSQRQRNARTVQEELEAALRALTGELVRTAFAGRTDAGVHGWGQVAAATVQTRLEPAEVRDALNARLPLDVAVRGAVEVPASFDPRRDARRRWYRYLIDNGGGRSPLRRGRAWHVPEPLELAALAEAAAALVGRRDVASFSGPLTGRRSTVRQLFRAEWSRRGRLLAFDLEATAFLPQQVRRTVGALSRVGLGRATVEEFRGLVERPRPGAAELAAPAHGLYLMKVDYEICDLGIDIDADL